MNNAVLGVVDDYSDEPWFGDAPATTTTADAPQKSLTDKLADWLGLAKQGAEVFQTATSKSDGTVTYVPTQAPVGDQNNTLKYVLIGGGAALAITTAAVLIARNGRKKKALGSVKERKKGR
jgi:hypothetical protein